MESTSRTQFRRGSPLPAATTHPILDRVQDAGKFAGRYIAWGVNQPGWWGESELYLDGDVEHSTLSGAWNCGVPVAGYTAYTTPYLGLHQILKPDGLYYSQQRLGMYRWHTVDPVHFHRDLRIEIHGVLPYRRV